MLRVSVNGQALDVPQGTTVAAAVSQAGRDFLRRSVSGERRGPLCGMGICFECRVTIDGVSQQRACIATCEEGMEIVADE